MDAHTRAGMFSPATQGARALVYVPNLADNTVSVIDQSSLQVVDVLRVGRQPQHVVPSWDLQTLWVNNNRGNSTDRPAHWTAGRPTGRGAGPVQPVLHPGRDVGDGDGRGALGEIDFYDPHTWTEQFRLRLDRRCRGVNHVDFSPGGSYAIATCESPANWSRST